MVDDPYNFKLGRSRVNAMTVAVSFKSSDQLVSERLVGVLDAWKRTTGDRMAPKREQITPSLLRNALPWIWMIDVIDGGKDFRFRIAGERVVQFLGRRHAGELLSDNLDNPFFQRMRAILLECHRSARPVATGPVRSNLKGKEFFEVEVIVMPLSEDGQNVTTLFGAIDLRGLPTLAK